MRDCTVLEKMNEGKDRCVLIGRDVLDFCLVDEDAGRRVPKNNDCVVLCPNPETARECQNILEHLGFHRQGATFRNNGMKLDILIADPSYSEDVLGDFPNIPSLRPLWEFRERAGGILCPNEEKLILDKLLNMPENEGKESIASYFDLKPEKFPRVLQMINAHDDADERIIMLLFLREEVANNTDLRIKVEELMLSLSAMDLQTMNEECSSVRDDRPDSGKKEPKEKDTSPGMKAFPYDELYPVLMEEVKSVFYRFISYNKDKKPYIFVLSAPDYIAYPESYCLWANGNTIMDFESDGYSYDNPKGLGLDHKYNNDGWNNKSFSHNDFLKSNSIISNYIIESEGMIEDEDHEFTEEFNAFRTEFFNYLIKCLKQLRDEKFFDSAYSERVLINFDVREYYSYEEMIRIFEHLNTKEEAEPYAKWLCGQDIPDFRLFLYPDPQVTKKHPSGDCR